MLSKTAEFVLHLQHERHVLITRD